MLRKLPGETIANANENFAEIDFLMVSDRGDRYLSDAFGPMKKYYS